MRLRSGFTLVEVMISIALALLLMLAISQIFGLAQQTTGGGNAVISAVENDRTVMTTLTDDFRGMVNGPNTPGFVIASTAIATWRNAVDQKQSTTNDIGELNPVAPGQSPTQLYFTQVNERIHRADRICFFARNKFTRQTGDTTITSPTTSNEAFIWMGHMMVPNNSLFSNNDWGPRSPAGTVSTDWAVSAWTWFLMITIFSPQVGFWGGKSFCCCQQLPGKMSSPRRLLLRIPHSIHFVFSVRKHPASVSPSVVRVTICCRPAWINTGSF